MGGFMPSNGLAEFLIGSLCTVFIVFCGYAQYRWAARHVESRNNLSWLFGGITGIMLLISFALLVPAPGVQLWPVTVLGLFFTAAWLLLSMKFQKGEIS